MGSDNNKLQFTFGSPMKTALSRLIICIIITIGAAATRAMAQHSEFIFPEFQSITTRDGLSNNRAFALMQDSRGFIWIPTNYGLNRYDGYEFKCFNYDPADTNSLSSSYFFGVLEGKNGIIWLSSTGGLYSFNQLTEKFTCYEQHPGNRNSLAGSVLNGNIDIDTTGVIWICTDNGLTSYNPEKKQFQVFTHIESDSTSIRSNHISWLCTDDENNLWVITSGNSVDVFNTSTKKVVGRFAIGSAEMPGDNKKPLLVDIKKGENGNLWLSSEDNGVYNYNTKTNKWKRLIYDQSNNYSLKDSSFSTCHEDKNGNLIIGSSNGRIYFYDAVAKRYNFSDEFQFCSHYITKDVSGKIWALFGNDGIYAANPVNKKFISRKINLSKGRNGNFVIGFYHSNNGELFICCGNGVFIFDKDKNSMKPFRILENGDDIFESNICWSIRQDSKGIFWYCTLNGLISYDEKTKSHHYYKFSEGNLNSIGGRSSPCIAEDNKGRLWITNFGGGLDMFNPATEKFRQYKVHAGTNSISSNHTAGIIKDSKGFLYIGTLDGGLMQLNPDNETFRIFKHHPSDPASISCDQTWPLFEDKNGILWVGTIGGGLNAFDPATEKFKTFTMNDGLPSNAVVSLVNDDDGKTWLGTFHGITCCSLPENPFDKNCKINFRNYDISDGLPSDELWVWGAHKEPDGTLFFSTGKEGFFYFNPRALKDNGFIPPVHITGFSLMNKLVSISDSVGVLKTPIDYTKEIELNYKQNILSFTFSALNFIHPEKNKYAYKLDGYDKDWIYTDASRRFATYTNLDPGEYIFKVKGSNNDGIWNDTPTELKIFITPPFWKTMWFKIIFLLIIFYAAYAIYRYRIGQILLLQRIRNKIAADLHDDIGSTLNSISIFSEVAKKDSVKREHALDMIGESSRRIIESMSDIVWSINPENDSLDKIIFRMRSLVHNLLKAKKIDCSFRADDSLKELKLPMEIRRNFYLIFKESINNLVKYSNANRASVLISHDNHNVTFIIRDDGIGFDVLKQHNGNGLKNMRRRAEEIHAKLNIESAAGKGTSIELNLKLR